MTKEGTPFGYFTRLLAHMCDRVYRGYLAPVLCELKRVQGSSMCMCVRVRAALANGTSSKGFVNTLVAVVVQLARTHARPHTQ